MNRSRAGLATIALVAFSLTLLLLAGCGDDYEPYLRGEGEFTLSGDIDEQVNCEVRWVKAEYSGGGGRGDNNFTSPGLICGEKGAEHFFMDVILWHDDDGAVPEVEEGRYPTILWSHDCPVNGPPCSTGQIFRKDDASLLTLADEGELILDRVDDGYISGSVDAVFAQPNEESSETVHIVGEFEVSRR